MEHTKKMILVDPRMLDSVMNCNNNPPVKDVTTESAKDIDQNMKDILERTDMSLYDKTIAYQQALHRFLQRIDQYKEKTSIPPPPPPPSVSQPKKNDEVEEDVVEKQVLESVPLTLKRKAKLLLNHIRRNPQLSWNEQGQLLHQGKVIEQTNLVDLVNDVMRKRKSVASPYGWDIFVSALQQSNVPKELVGNPQRLKYLTKVPVDTESETPSKTNRKARKRQSLVDTWQAWDEV